LGFSTLATSYKDEAEGLLLRHPDLTAFVPAVSEAERRRYDGIKSLVSSQTPTVVSDANPQPAVKVSGGVLNGPALNKIKPAYPATAREAGASGTVEVRVVFDETGKVIWAKAVSGHPQLRQAAEDAAWQTKFSPTILSGQAGRTSGILLYNFVP
jgi:TonB family protein